MSFKVGDLVRPNTAVQWVNDQWMGTEVLKVTRVTENPRYFEVEDKCGNDQGLWTEKELLLHQRAVENKRVTIRGDRVTVVSEYPSEVIVEVENSGTISSESFVPESYVQVKTSGYASLTYCDPSRKLEVGDRVIVPLGWKNQDAIGEVVALGRGLYTGPAKDVRALLVRQELTEVAA